MNEALILLQILTQSAQSISVVSGIITTMAQENRTKMTPDEWKIVLGNDDSARANLVNAIAARMAAPSATPPATA